MNGVGTIITNDSNDILGEKTKQGKNRLVYQGDVVENKMHGHGVLTYEATGYEYEGAFYENLKHGYGVERSRIEVPRPSGVGVNYEYTIVFEGMF